MNFYGPTTLPVGATIYATDASGVTCGATVVARAGQDGLLACYGDDPRTPLDEGAAPGETVRLLANRQALGAGVWSGFGERRWLPLGDVPLQRWFLPLMQANADTRR